MEVDFTIEELDTMARKDLQALAKRFGIKANLKSAAIIELLIEYYNEHCTEDKENSAGGANAVSENVTATPVKTRVEEETVCNDVEPMEEVTQEEMPQEKASEEVEEMVEEPAAVETTPKKTYQPLVSPSPIRRTLPKNPVPPSPMQKFVRNASAALTPRKTPLRPPQTPANDLYIITPRKHKNKKNLFNPASPPKRPESSTFDVDPFGDVKTDKVVASPMGLFTVLSVLSDGDVLLADYASVTFLVDSLCAVTQSILKQAMKEEGVTQRSGFTLKHSAYNAALSSVLTGELAKNALFESEKVRERYAELQGEEWDGKLLGLALDHSVVKSYLDSLEVQTETTDDLLALTACLEYISSEIWELSEKKEFGEFNLIQLDGVVEGIKGDQELSFTFERQVEKELSAKPTETERLSKMVPRGSVGADSQALSDVEATLRFPLPEELRAFLSVCDGCQDLGVDTCQQIRSSTTFYEEVSLVYSLMNWIPIRSHNDSDVWDCLDARSGLVIRASMLPDDLEMQVNPCNFPVIARSFTEYLERYEAGNEGEFLDATDAKTLKEVSPVLADVAQFWINISADEVDEEF